MGKIYLFKCRNNKYSNSLYDQYTTNSINYNYCRNLLRFKPKSINMLQLQGYIQKMNFIYKPDVQQMCENYASMKNKSIKN